MKTTTIVTGGLSGGVSAAIAGGNFWDGFKQGIITAGLNHVAHSVTDWLTAKMDIKANKSQTGETDCVPTVGKVAGKYLGIEIDVKDKQEDANRLGGIKSNQTKEFFESMGLKVDAFYENKANGDYYFHNGIPSVLNQQAIKFIVESIQAGHPIYIGFSDTDMAGNNMGHAVLVTEIKYTADFSRMRYINYFDPATAGNTGQLISFQNTHSISQTIYNIFSISKP